MQSPLIITTHQLARDLTRLGLRAGQVVLAHTSMKALGGYVFEKETSAVSVGKVAGATARWMKQRPLVDFAMQWREAHRPASLNH
jgi:aminoglycoside N3'-acetyltransferase